MPTMIQIRNVPDAVHRTLKARAALEGSSLSDYLRMEMEKLAALPSTAELRQQLALAQPFGMSRSSAELIRHERDAA